MRRRIIPYLFSFLISFSVFGQEAYNETFRPQFHFTAKEGWIGDPCGLTKYEGKYHFFWWGHAVSDDLVHWEEMKWPMQGGSDFAYFTGSIVVDKENTTGFSRRGIVPMIAVYTSAWSSGLQNQGISYSLDYENFYYYSENPVLDLNSHSFRDPDVIWHEPSQRWIMSITLSDDRKVDFFSSPDLKSWEYLSSFALVGAIQEIWEVPSLIQLPVDGNFNNKKWVLIVGMGPNKVQYFVGHFDGREFHLDESYNDFLRYGRGIEGDIYCSFENDHYSGWHVEGTAFGDAPIFGSVSGQSRVSGYLGDRLVNSYIHGDGAVGKLISPSFEIQKNNINFLIGGGDNYDHLCIRLVVDGQIVRQATGHNSEQLKWKGWNVSEFKGKQGLLEIVDEVTGGWGHILVDQIMFSDVLLNQHLEHTLWGDYGPDFYAARPYRDYDDDNSVPLWQAWMSNWEYANDVPTTPFKGLQSIPREIGLKTTNKGFQLYQQPFVGFEKLRKQLVSTRNYKINDLQTFDIFQPERNVYETEFVFERSENPKQNFGINFCSRRGSKVVLGYDAATSNVYFDRTQSGNVSFNGNFPKTLTIPVASDIEMIKFRVFVDQSSIEIFINDGESVISSLMFPHPSATTIEVFSNEGETNLIRFYGWELESIWNKEESNIHETNDIQNEVKLFSSEKGEITIDAAGQYVKKIEVFNLHGQLIYKKDNIHANGIIPIDTFFVQGCYLLRLNMEDAIISKKFIV